ncbi:hypothetical protein HK101_003774 [Irineochytrium annulatum]|nr:hypothetical protein HK101_003774 [Irineochytrium annulatum]
MAQEARDIMKQTPFGKPPDPRLVQFLILMELDEYLFRNVFSHTDDDRLGRRALLSCVLTCRSMFEIAVPFLWRSMAVDSYAAKIQSSTVQRGFSCYELTTVFGVPLYEWLCDLGKSKEPADRRARSRIELYIRSVPNLVLRPGSPMLLEPAQVDRWMDVRHIAIVPYPEVIISDGYIWAGWLQWVNDLVAAGGGGRRVRKVTMNGVKVRDADKTTLAKIINLPSVTEIEVAAPQGENNSLSTILDLRTLKVDRLTISDVNLDIKNLQLSADDARAINRLASRSPDLTHITWSLHCIFKTNTGARLYPDQDILYPDDIIVASGACLRDFSLLSCDKELLEQSRIVNALKNLRVLHLVLDDVMNSTVNALSQMVEIVDLSLVVEMRGGVGSWSIDDALEKMPALRRLKLKNAFIPVDEDWRKGFTLKLTGGLASNLQLIELDTGVVTVDDAALEAFGMPELVRLDMSWVEVQAIDGKAFDKEMRGILKDLSRMPCLAYCRWSNKTGRRLKIVR